MSSLQELRDSRELLVNLTMRDVRGKYRRTVLGQGWSLLNPLATLAIFTVVFGVLLRAGAPVGRPSGVHAFALWLACALLPWTFFSTALTVGMQSLLGNAGLISKVWFPRELLPVSSVLAGVVTFATELGVLTVLLLAFGGMPLPWLPLVVVAVGLLTAFALGLALLLSIALVYFRDTSYLVALVLQFWFYLTPVVYPVSLVDGAVRRLGLPPALRVAYGLNPMERFAGVFRALLYDNRLPGLTDWAGVVASAAVSVAVGALVFRRFSPRLAEEL